MGVVLFWVHAQIGHEKDNFQGNGLLHHSEHKVNESWGKEYLKSILATNNSHIPLQQGV